MLSTAGNKLDPRVRRTRQAIRQAFHELNQERHNFDQLTVQEIAERAGVNRATFYAHFDDKYALLDDSIAEGFQSRLAKYLPADYAGIVGVGLLVRVTCELLHDLLSGCTPATQAQHGGLLMRQLQRSIKTVVRADLDYAGDPRRDELAVTFMTWAIFGAAFDWVQSPKRVPAEKLADDVVKLLQTGMPDTASCTGSPASARV